MNTEEYAKKIDWHPRWDGNATRPQLLIANFSTFLIYNLSEDDDYYLKTKPYKKQPDLQLALVEFEGMDFKFGIANDEVHSGLPLYEKGVKHGDAFTIENSSWIKEIKQIHSVHPYYNESKWDDYKHYLFLFKDNLFEIIAKGYKIQTFETTYKELLTETIQKIYQLK